MMLFILKTTEHKLNVSIYLYHLFDPNSRQIVQHTTLGGNVQTEIRDVCSCVPV